MIKSKIKQSNLKQLFILTLVLVAIIDFLFYKHSTGINMGVFIIVMSGVSFYLYPDLRKDKNGIIWISCFMVSSKCIFNKFEI